MLGSADDWEKFVCYEGLKKCRLGKSLLTLSQNGAHCSRLRRFLIIFVWCRSIRNQLCKTNTIHIASISSSTMDSNIQQIVEDSPLVGHNQSAILSLSPPSQPRKRSRSTLEGLHTIAKSSELPCLPSLDQCHLPGSPTIHPFKLQRRTIEYTTFQDDIDNKKASRGQGLSFAGFQFPRILHEAMCWPPRL